MFGIIQDILFELFDFVFGFVECLPVAVAEAVGLEGDQIFQFLDELELDHNLCKMLKISKIEK